MALSFSGSDGNGVGRMFPGSSQYSPYANGASHVGNGEGSFSSMDFAHQPRGPESGLAVPHVLSMQSIIGTAWRTYYHSKYDEALRDSQENANAMRADPFVRRLIDEIKYSVCSLKPSIEVDNIRDPWQKAMKDSMTAQWKTIPNPYDLNWYLLESRWYGRYGSQMSWYYKNMDLPAMPKVGGVQPGLPAILGAPSGREKRKALCMRWHIPYEGDKIGYDYEGCPYILVSTMAGTNLKNQGAKVGPIPDIRAKSMEYGYTTAGGMALFLRDPSWRQRFAIHTGEILDSPFMNAEAGDQIHGIGIRSVIYWYWWLRDEFLSNVTDWCARTGLGVRLWYYDASNPQSEAAVGQAARDQSDKVNIMIPRFPGSDAQEGVEFVDTSGTGANLLLEIVRWIEEHIELYAVGQSMSKGGQENNGSGFGDRGRADFARGTKHQITKREATKLGSTMTTDILDVMKRWSFPPDLQEIPMWVTYNLDVVDPESFMAATKTFVELGGQVQEDDTRSKLGLADVKDGDNILGGVPPIEEGKPGEEKPDPNSEPATNGTPRPATATITNGKAKPDKPNGHPTHERFEIPSDVAKTEDEYYQEFRKKLRESRRSRR